MFKKYFIICVSFCMFINILKAEDDFYEEEEPSSVSYEYKQPSKKKNNSYNSISNKEKKYYPSLEGRIMGGYIFDSKLNSEKTVSRDKKQNTQFELETDFKLNITKNFYTQTNWYLSPVEKRRYTNQLYGKEPNNVIGDSFNSDFYGKQDYVLRKNHFYDYGLSIRELELGFIGRNIALGGGKITPEFGMAFEKTRFYGVYGVDMPEEYKLSEKLGGYVAALLPIGNITFSLFTDDTTQLSSTMFKRTRKDKSKGGAGNTNKLNNFAISYNGNFFDDDLTIRAAYRAQYSDYMNEETGEKDVKESGWTGGIEYLLYFEDYDISFKPLFEYTYLDNFDSMKNRQMTYITTFVPFMFENWHFMFSNTFKIDSEKGYRHYNSYLTQFSVGYKFDFGLMFDVARIWSRNAFKNDLFENVEERRKWVRKDSGWAIMVSYIYEFNTF